MLAPAGVAVSSGSQYDLAPGFVISDSIKNTNLTAELVRFVITPYTWDNNGMEKCGGINDTAYIYVEPTAQVDLTPKQDTICNESRVSIGLTTPNTATNAVRFKYSVDAPAGVDVTSGSQYDLAPGFVITDSIKNNNQTAELVRFIITPYTWDNNGIEKCGGINDTAYVYVEPTVYVDAEPELDTICNNTAT